MIKLLVFDFDGTLVDTKNVIYDLVEQSIQKFNYNVERVVLQQELGNKPLQEFLPLLGIKKKDVARIIDDSNIEQIKNVSQIRGTKSLNCLGKIHKKKIIISNNISEFIKDILHSLNITFFEEIYGIDDLKKDKAQKIKQIMKSDKLKPSEIIYLGDKEIDIHVARKVGCYSVILSNEFSWGDKKAILKSKPDFIITSLTQVKDIVKKLDKTKS